jgi:hypothetical protein
VSFEFERKAILGTRGCWKILNHWWLFWAYGVSESRGVVDFKSCAGPFVGILGLSNGAVLCRWDTSSREIHKVFKTRGLWNARHRVYRLSWRCKVLRLDAWVARGLFSGFGLVVSELVNFKLHVLGFYFVSLNRIFEVVDWAWALVRLMWVSGWDWSIYHLGDCLFWNARESWVIFFRILKDSSAKGSKFRGAQGTVIFLGF